MTAAEVIAKCIEHDYNRTFHDTALCILGDLKAAGYAVVELPKPQANWNGSMTAWPVTQSWKGEPYHDGEVNIRPSDGRIVDHGVSNPCDTPADARSYAAALLAAADAAEVVS